MNLSQLLASLPQEDAGRLWGSPPALGPASPAIQPPRQGSPDGARAAAGANPDPQITGIAYDSRHVRPGMLFVAVWHPGYTSDGHAYVRQAVEAGAAAAVAQRPIDVPDGVPLLLCADTGAALGWLSAAFYGMPARQLGMAGVTGTDGKTTTSTMMAAILEAGGWRTGLATTVASGTAGDVQPTRAHTTTPEAPELQALLAGVVATGGQRAVVEATSQALHQGRLEGCVFDVAVVTRITHDHLDYHGTWENYLAAKAHLFDLLRREPRDGPPPAHLAGVAPAVVLNRDDRSYAPLWERALVPVVSYSLEGAGDVQAHEVELGAGGTRCRVTSPWGDGTLALAVPGLFNVYNALAALAGACVLGARFETALAALAAFKGVAGRMERVEQGQPFAVVVDFAHTPDSLGEVLRFLRRHTPGRIFAVLGSAGERDREKRPQMGRVAAANADVVVLTEDDPRREDPLEIIDEMAAGALAAGAVEGRGLVRIPNRRRAIAAALAQARPGDSVLLAGKGHQQSMTVAREGRIYEAPWDERGVATEELARLGYTGRQAGAR